MGFFQKLKKELEGKTNGITDLANMELKKFNIIIGKNGAGKTRLLKLIRDDFINQPATVIYAYFPDINPHFSRNTSNKKYDLPLYEVILDNQDINLDNFIQYIESEGYEFLCELLRDIIRYSKYDKSHIKEEAQKIQVKLNLMLENLINRTLIFESEIMVKSKIYNTTQKLIDDLEQMSPGELSLFYLSILLIYLEYNSENSIVLLLDEPELHLHPDALMKFTNYLKAEPAISICCIATHSIFLIPSVDFSEIVYIKDSKIQKRNSETYNEIYESIVGNHKNISEYLISRDMWKYYEYIAECFCLPVPVSKKRDDEQLNKFFLYIEQIQKIKKTITVLDYGAGKGRLGLAIKEKTSDFFIEEKVNYVYYDKYEKFPPKNLNCQKYRDIKDIYSTNQAFDCVVLMNVLHEIDIQEWLRTFDEIYNVLDSNGYLLIFEVISMQHGEQPYGNTGYILLGECEINKLFKTTNIKNYGEDQGKKTNMFIIKKELLRNVSEQSIMDTLLTLRNNLFNELRKQYKIRREYAHNKEKPSQQTIKNYGFLSQHYLNSIFAIEVMQNKNNIENASNAPKK